MQQLIARDYRELSRLAADRVSAVVAEKPAAVLGLATGSTPIGLYAELVARSRAGELDLRQVTTFNLDEYLGLPRTHPASYWQFMQAHLFRHVPVRAERIHLPRGDAPDPEAECRAYEAAIAAAGGIDLQVLGIGGNGHIGFNEPGAPFDSVTRVVDLTAETRAANARFFARPDEVPRQAISMGIRTIMQARRILLLASGEGKAAAVAAALTGPVTTAVPASVLQRHPDVTVIMDAAAAGLLPAAAGSGR